MPRRSRRRRIHEEQERRWVDPLIEKLEERKLGPPPYAKRIWVWDDDIPHYGLMLTQKGKRSFVFDCRLGRQTFERGRVDDPREARKWAAKLKLQLDAGILEPPARKPARYEEKTLRRAAHEYVASRGPSYKSGPALLSSLEKNAASLMGRPIESLGRGEVTRLADEVARNVGRHAAGAMVKHVNVVGRWYAKRTDSYSWPTVDSPVTKQDRRGRDRGLEDHEISALWHAANRFGVFGRYVQFLLLTALRRNEAAFLTRAEVDPDFTKITLAPERIKTRVAFVLPLSAAAADLLRSMPPDGELFFPYGSVSRCKARLDAMLNIPHWTLHDLRRTSATLMERAGVLPHVIDKTLNHVTRGVAGVYARHNYIEEKRDAVERLASLLKSITE